MTVTPIWTVESSLEGSAFSSSAACAPGLPASASGRRRAFRAATSAISAIAKKPFTMISSRMIERCRVSIATACRGCVRRGRSRPQCRANRAMKKAAPKRGFWPGSRTRSAGIEFDHEIGLHRHGIGHVGRLGGADEPAPHAFVVDLDIIGDVALAGARRLEHERHLLRLRLELDRVAVANRV